ncbi:hypothetical protein GW17_00029260 [Ensete ventricosum]|nr:hypothetical protein GW17_00029260 [Ensete ventricosum]RZS03951.1 hypothetical protein BHM03_00034209 [Ensete ventricosum]
MLTHIGVHVRAGHSLACPVFASATRASVANRQFEQCPELHRGATIQCVRRKEQVSSKIELQGERDDISRGTSRTGVKRRKRQQQRQRTNTRELLIVQRETLKVAFVSSLQGIYSGKRCRRPPTATSPLW